MVKQNKAEFQYKTGTIDHFNFALFGLKQLLICMWTELKPEYDKIFLTNIQKSSMSSNTFLHNG